MVVGNGLLAKAFDCFEMNDNVVVFASGVSNSQEEKKHEFKREEKLLTNTISKNKTKVFVYFSTCSIEDKSKKKSLYVEHKKNMESIIREHCDEYYIFRLPQVVGISNSPTVINFFVDSIVNNKPLNIYKNATRNLIHVDDTVEIVSTIINQKYYLNETINIATQFNLPIPDIIGVLERLLGRTANCNLIQSGEAQTIDISIIEKLKIKFEDGYVESILKKYIKDKGLLEAS